MLHGPIFKNRPSKTRSLLHWPFMYCIRFQLDGSVTNHKPSAWKNHHHLCRTQFHFPYHINWNKNPQNIFGDFFHYFELYSSYPSQSAPSSFKAIISRGIILASISLKPAVDCPNSFPCEGETKLFSSKEPTGDPCMYATQALRTCGPRRLKCSRTNSSKCCCKR